MSNGATLGFDGGSTTLNASAVVSGAGTVEFGGGTTTFATGSTYDISGATVVDGGTANFNSGAQVQAIGSPLTISTGIINFSSGETIDTGTLTESVGTLTGSDTVNVSGLTTWSGGTMSGTGITNVNGGMTLGGNFTTLSGRTLATIPEPSPSSATAVFISPSAMAGWSTTSLCATWDYHNDAALNSSGTATFNNAGTFEKTAGTGNTQRHFRSSPTRVRSTFRQVN